MSHHFIEFTDVGYVYSDGTRALSGISFTVLHGESVGLVGANGAGKSTLLLQINGYLFPTEGTVNVGNVIVSRDTVNDVRRRVGVVFQNPDDQLFMPRVYDDVAFGPFNLGWDSKKVEEKTLEALQTVGCLDLKHRPPHRLSIGQKRAVSIATVLSMEPDILVMDEPSSNLDPKARRQLINLLRTFKHTRVIASHDLDLILDTCARTIVLHAGRIAADGPTPDILRDDALLAANNLERPLSLQGRAEELSNLAEAKEICPSDFHRRAGHNH
ncbi:MAG: ABC transporter ATP-binding protein [Deltaproteobacteria bacterium]|nr:ABC transporter ATP-binding protein [Deltaproteobacteria bacterium]